MSFITDIIDNNPKVNGDFFKKCFEDVVSKIRHLSIARLADEKIALNFNYCKKGEQYAYCIDYVAELFTDRTFQSINEVWDYLKENNLTTILGDQTEDASRDYRKISVPFENGSICASFDTNPSEGLSMIFGYNAIVYTLKLSDESKKNLFDANCTLHFPMER